MIQIAQNYQIRGRYTAGYRRIQMELDKSGIHLAGDTIRRLMKDLNIQVTMYNRHRNGKYSSYRGKIGKTFKNRVHQNFNARQPYQVIHTDVSQVRLANKEWAYLSVMVDEASKEVLAYQVSSSPNRRLITDTLDKLIVKLPDNVQPIIHSDQGWHYQLDYYTQKLADNGFIQSMSRKGNCLDNAPVESFFHIFKTELLNGCPPCRNLADFKQLTANYITFFNSSRISLKTKGMTPIEYRNHALTA